MGGRRHVLWAFKVLDPIRCPGAGCTSGVLLRNLGHQRKHESHSARVESGDKDSEDWEEETWRKEEERGGLWTVLGRSMEVLTEKDGLVREAERPTAARAAFCAGTLETGVACVVSACWARREGAKGRLCQQTQEGWGPRHAEGWTTEKAVT